MYLYGSDYGLETVFEGLVMRGQIVGGFEL